MVDELARLDAVAQAALVRDGEATPVELVQGAIDRIEALDGELNAVIHTSFERALEEAAGDLPDGPFRGVPMLMKDLWPTSAGDPFHMGIKGFKDAGYIHPADSNLTTRYREAGFVMVGRTNTPELGLVATTEPRWW
ncbi:MAG: amidase family protein, partial [Actinomycetota bacterium]